MNIFYTKRYNDHFNFYEVLEHIPELERVTVIKECYDVMDAVKEIHVLEKEVVENNFKLVMKEVA